MIRNMHQHNMHVAKVKESSVQFRILNIRSSLVLTSKATFDSFGVISFKNAFAFLCLSESPERIN
jgi:hypothetical protein